MNFQEQLNRLSVQIAKKISHSLTELNIETDRRNSENLQIQSDIVETVIDEYNTVIGG